MEFYTSEYGTTLDLLTKYRVRADFEFYMRHDSWLRFMPVIIEPKKDRKIPSN